MQSLTLQSFKRGDGEDLRQFWSKLEFDLLQWNSSTHGKLYSTTFQALTIQKDYLIPSTFFYLSKTGCHQHPKLLLQLMQ